MLITLYGTKGDTGQRELTDSGGDLFEKDRTDTFYIQSFDIGQVGLVSINSLHHG